jgi:hypothetical protein
MKRIVLLLLMLTAVPAGTQQHAPTVAQCQADAAVWAPPEMQTEYLKAQTAHIKYGTPNETSTNKLPIKEVLARIDEMGDCQKVDHRNWEKFLEIQSFYSNVQTDRVQDFMTRHDLWPQFRSEDAQGKR